MYKEIRLASKRNKVFRVEEGDKSYIRKVYSQKDSLLREETMLRILYAKEVNVPEIMDKGEEYMILRDLGGHTLLDWFEKAELEDMNDYEDVVDALATFLRSFYQAIKEEFSENLCLYDMNMRNFIMVGNSIFRVDLEQVQKGSMELDTGRLLAYVMTYDPAGTEWKKRFRKDLLLKLCDWLELDLEETKRQEALEIERMKTRRKD